jgi:protein-tyrosine-phosphatase
MASTSLRIGLLDACGPAAPAHDPSSRGPPATPKLLDMVTFVSEYKKSVTTMTVRAARPIIAAFVFMSAVGGATAWTSQQAPARPADARKPPTVLFMCPHGAAKSVLASAYFQRLAKERGLNVRVMSAGTDPDSEVSPAVASHLAKNGYDVPVSKPRRATADDIAAADVIISLGCDLKDLPAPRGTLLKWDDVPAPSEDFARADQKIRERVTQLVEDLLRKQAQPDRRQ